jgi:hypothetical protein
MLPVVVVVVVAIVIIVIVVIMVVMVAMTGFVIAVVVIHAWSSIGARDEEPMIGAPPECAYPRGEALLASVGR